MKQEDLNSGATSSCFMPCGEGQSTTREKGESSERIGDGKQKLSFECILVPVFSYYFLRLNGTSIIYMAFSMSTPVSFQQIHIFT